MSKRQRAGTLKKVVKYDKEAFDKAWAWMASSSSDDEEDFFFPSDTNRHFFLPRKFLGFRVVPQVPWF